MNDFQFVLCPGSNPDKSKLEIYNRIYDCWFDVWSKAFSELNVNKKIYSDAFSRQDFVGALLFREEPVAMSLFRYADFKCLNSCTDSYFQNWTSSDIEQLTSRGSNILVCSYFTVHERVRQCKVGVSVKDLLVGISIETFKNLAADGMTGAVRVDRGVNDACYRWGAYPIKRDVESGLGDKVDLVGFFKDYLAEQPTNIMQPLVENLYNNREVIVKSDYQSELKLIQPTYFKNRSA